MVETALRQSSLVVLVALCACVRAPPSSPTPIAEGQASFYGADFAGHPTASGVPFDPAKLTAAHRTLPFGSCVRVVEATSGREVQVQITDRGPFVASRLIDLSQAAARALGIVEAGLARVRLYPCR